MKMNNTVKVTFNINGIEVIAHSGVPKLKDGINKDNMIVLNAKEILERELGIDVYKILNADHYEQIQHLITIDKSNYITN